MDGATYSEICFNPDRNETDIDRGPRILVIRPGKGFAVARLPCLGESKTAFSCSTTRNGMSKNCLTSDEEEGTGGRTVQHNIIQKAVNRREQTAINS